MTLERQESRAPMVYIKHGKIMKMSRRNIQDRFIFLVRFICNIVITHNIMNNNIIILLLGLVQ